MISATPLVRRPGPLDAVLVEVDRALQVLSRSAVAGRAYPARAAETALTETEKRHAAGLMRVNHVGEVCAQALYRGQAAVCRDGATRELLREAAAEEVDHLAWCDERLKELGSRPSLLNPFWYAGSFALGVAASVAGVPRNLGFMAETERQVEAHLDEHLHTLPADDERSREIVRQMKDDEAGHRESAERAGGVALPAPVRGLMRAMSKVMTRTAYHL
ncbi:2-polyprenyl-3-methyl-6-methoxy-1,4-benzoquinone monooxygenase [Bordetella hinzii]|uniref:3-demethoxyubiquinol 3-hydroxylase n=2 Tax=Bordetella hinzii TaxID=103855 RepID=A0AAN1VES4_9BORD|nr:2-polyprenyl-3-methyl-6-methoxy-1,4-benzoquinone monooxygenase [Bordetella hinzii]AKQ54066.1 2-nonaprenyl-3-methyl-6-methoxy-1,4-benzoquinol hydroxylase [Bordetella hinzii]AKQ58556.1 2-nonaprenyl-3-methyl-6-methoxy-1,4-benzoquinol hydroxylase [Bordetella hinzii]AZW16139.1 demethoxyubiquinone hydroxylase family protein [Bordetella hinzii]KCB22448.1 ubiquinone biosynthesis protein COQ7 [Bordetella hinzii OH87 BAL007II]KCB29312.1 ubiquinone biosynthesis protein COQ7 [Bordetella hinzii CA90 BAL